MNEIPSTIQPYQRHGQKRNKVKGIKELYVQKILRKNVIRNIQIFSWDEEHVTACTMITDDVKLTTFS
jgi:hypothetical protein